MRASMVRRICWMVAGTAALAGAALWVLPARVSVPPGAPVIHEGTTMPVPPAVDPAVAEEIALANVFAASRTPPASRYLPPELAGDSAYGTMDDPGATTPMAPEVAGEGMEVPRLFGTVVGPGGTRALLHLDAGASGPRLYGPGDRDGGYQVVSIAPRAVVLRGPRGRVTLRLDPEEDRP